MNLFRLKNFFKPKLKLTYGTRLVSFLFIAFSIIIAAGFLFAANMYYNIDTGEVVTEEIQRVTGTLRATASLIVGGSDTQNPASGYDFEVVGKAKLATTTFATGTVELTAADQFLKFSGGTGDYVGFKATTTLATTSEYTLPTSFPAATDYYLTVDPTTGQMNWGYLLATGDITAVGNVTSGAAFTSDGTQGTSLWFYDANGRGQLTIADLTTTTTYTLPNASGTLVLGTGTANYIAYWNGTNTLAAEQYLSTGRGGIGEDSSGWNGMIRVVSGDWGPITGTTNYAAYWSDDNTVAAEQYLALSRGGTAANLTAAAGGIVYSGASALAISGVGSSNQILTSGGTSAPSWTDIADLIIATNGLTESGTSTLTLTLGGTLTGTTTITQGNNDMIFALTGTGDFMVTDGTSTIFRVTPDGRVLYGSDDFAIAESGKQILREMIPILGFDLPVQTATTSYVKISKTLENYPFLDTATGTTRVHKLVFRYAASTTADIDWRISTSTGETYSSSTLPQPTSDNLEQGDAYVATTTIPTDGTDWWLDVKTTNGADTVRIFQILLAAYDQID